MNKFLSQNIRPIALIVLFTAIGALFGSWSAGLIVGVIIVAAATLFF